jgi:uncharacterized membrane protein
MGVNMSLEWEQVVRLVHIVAASLWFGGGVFMLLMIMPVVNASGPIGKAFMASAMRRGGFGRYYGSMALLTVLSGLILYVARGFHDRPFDTAADTALTIGGLLGILAFAEGLAVALPTELKLKRVVAEAGDGPPNPEQATRLDALGQKLGKASVRGVAMIGLAMLAMVGRTLL